MRPARQAKVWPGAVLLAAGMLAASCAWEAGTPFATLEATLDAHLELPRDRDLGDGWQKLASGYELTIEQLVVEAGEIALLDPGAGARGFDPANPPPGYSLCHNGHCHADDGRLVAYEDIIAELARGTGARVVVALPVGALDLAAGVSRPLACLPDCDLPLASITLASLDVIYLQAQGLVRDGRDPARIEGALPWRLDLAFSPDDPLVWTGPLALPADRAHAPDVSLRVEIAAGSKLFDRIAWSALAPDSGTLDLAGDPDARAALIEALGELRLVATPSR